MRWGLLTPHAIAYLWRRTPRRSRRIGASLGVDTLELPMTIYSGAGGDGLTGTQGMCRGLDVNSLKISTFALARGCVKSALNGRN